MMYEAMGLPFKFSSFDELSKKQTENFFQWYIGQIGHRMDVLRNCIISEGNDIPLDYMPESLISLWEWYEQKIAIEKKTEEELK